MDGRRGRFEDQMESAEKAKPFGTKCRYCSREQNQDLMNASTMLQSTIGSKRRFSICPLATALEKTG